MKHSAIGGPSHYHRQEQLRRCLTAAPLPIDNSNNNNNLLDVEDDDSEEENHDPLGINGKGIGSPSSSAYYDLSHLLPPPRQAPSRNRMSTKALVTTAMDSDRVVPTVTECAGEEARTSSPGGNKQRHRPAQEERQRRSVGEEADDDHSSDSNGNSKYVPIDTSFLSMESKDTAGSGLTAEETTDASSDCATEASSSVAALRGWLNDFGQQNKTHYEKTSIATPIAGKAANLDKPTRLKVHHKQPQLPKQQPPSYGTARKGVVPANRRFIVSVPADSNKNKDLLQSCPAVRRNYATPVRIKPKIDDSDNDVQATNEGYASVAKLSAWLAEDPTSKKKKVRQIRRGANVLEKSRKYDKGLANVIIEQTHIRTGNINAMKQQIQQSLSGCGASSYDDEDEDYDDELSYDLCSRPSDERVWATAKSGAYVGKAKSTVGVVYGKDSALSIGVSDKKAWLSSAFKERRDAVHADIVESSSSSLSGGDMIPPPPTVERAATDFLTGDDHRNDVSDRAKKIWRQRTPPRMERRLGGGVAVSNSLTTSTVPLEKDARNEIGESAPRTPPKQSEAGAQPKTPSRRASTADGIRSTNTTETGPPRDVVKMTPARLVAMKNAPPKEVPEQANDTSDDEASVGFRKAREMLVKRSKKNGNAVEVLNKVTRRKALFEHLATNNRRMSMPHGRLKTSWIQEPSSVEGPATATSNGNNRGNVSATATASGKYKKEYVEDVCPKKSLEELPK